MRISRRHLFRQIGAGAAMTAAAPSLAQAFQGAQSGSQLSPVRPARFSHNENPYGPSARAIAALLEAAQQPGHYPDIEAQTLRERIAGSHGVTADHVALGCGSSEILRMAVDAFASAGRRLILPVPTRRLIEGYARRAGAEIVAVRLTANHAHDLEAMLARSDPGTGLVYICNPNSPTGSLTGRQELEGFLRRLPETVHVLVDESYHHYVGESSFYASFLDHPVDDRRVIVVRSFSKIYGLAGLRVGYAVAAPEVVRLLTANGLTDNVNVVAARAALAALDDREYVRTSVRRNADDRQEFLNQANARMLRAIDSHANFVMLNAERPAAEVVERLKDLGVLIAPPFPPLDKYIRVSVRRPTEMGEFWAAWDKAFPHKMAM